MDVDQLFAQYQGQTIPASLVGDSDITDDGQCAVWAILVRTKVYGLPTRYGNAIDWWNSRGNDSQYFDYISFVPGTYPKTGDFVVWGTGVGSQFGHIDVCAQDGHSAGFVGFDSNWQDIPTLRQIQHDYGWEILGYIRRKATEGEEPMVNEGDITNAFQLMTGASPRADDVAAWVGKDWKTFAYNCMIPLAQLNGGDAANIAKALGGDAGQYTGKPWKPVAYQLLADVAAPAMTKDAVIAYITENLQ